jgi:hypothetical protein
MTPDVREELARLRAENARLIGLLETHAIVWRAPGGRLELQRRRLPPSR